MSRVPNLVPRTMESRLRPLRSIQAARQSTAASAPAIADSPARIARTRQRWLFGIPAAAGLIFFAASGKYFTDSAQLDMQRRVLDAHEKVLRHAQPLESMVQQSASALGALAAASTIARQTEVMDITAEQLLSRLRDIAALEIATPNSSRRWNNMEHGLSIQAQGEQPLQRSPSTPFPQGRPFARFEDGRLVLTQAMFYRQDGTQLAPWGEVRAEVALKRMMIATELGELLRAGYSVQLVYLSADGSMAGQIAGSDKPILGAREREIMMPDGDSLRLRVGPLGGISPGPIYYVELSLSAVAALLLAILIHATLLRLGNRARGLPVEANEFRHPAP